ncbi:MAG: beta-glucosidase [Spirochaetes bacterium]|nr:MAG: beta-glucosidase [Spirochaetota bacterium]
MIGRILKHMVQKVMMSSSPDGHQSEMNLASVEDTDFQGLPPDSRTPGERAEEVLSSMSLEEKLGFVTGYKSLAIRALPRQGLPSVWMSDASSGPRSFGAATAFPSSIAMAASWNHEIATLAADHIAESARAKGISILLGPGVNIARIPTCGRNFEYFGEDPFLAGTLAAAYVKACTRRGVICTVKHLAVNNSEYDRHKVSSDLSERTLREIYLPAFEMAVKEGKTRGIMSSYNPVNGVWASENRKLLTQILRDEWGFDGFVVSDWNSLYSTVGPMKAGLDIEMPAAKWLTPEKVKDGEDDLDRMAGNILRTLFAAGIYDRPVKDSQAREFHTDHNDAALKAAREGIVLLKNEGGTLPLPQGDGITIALCGPLAVESSTLGGGSCHIARTTGTVSLFEGLKAAASGNADADTVAVKIVYVQSLNNPGSRKILREADAVVIACGFNYQTESELYDRPWRLPPSQRRLIHRVSRLNSRCAVILTAGGGVETESWIDEVPALLHGMYLGQTVGRATAEILFGIVNPSGKLPFTMARHWKDIPSVKNYPKRYWTTNARRIALGQGNPSLRKIRHWQYEEGLMVGYRHFDTAGVEPAFPFGFGLSYTSFAIEVLRLSAKTIVPEDSLDVIVKVENTGKRAGSEVVQVYVADTESRLPRPKKELKGFAKVELEPGEAVETTIRLNPRAFCYWDSEAGGTDSPGAWVAEPGEFRILVGRNSGLIESENKVRLSR